MTKENFQIYIKLLLKSVSVVLPSQSDFNDKSWYITDDFDYVY